MSRPALLAALLLATSLSGPRAALAAEVGDMLVDVTLTTGWRPDPTGPNESPTVHSYAVAYIYDRTTGGRIYRPIILDHGVADLNDSRSIYTGRLTSANGYVSSSTRDLFGAADHCYAATAVGHSNDFNLHKRNQKGPVCMPDPPERPEVPEENCPVVLDLDLDGFHLSGPDPAVHFDIDADGAPDRIAWTRAADDDAFLCLDRNRNGAIDDGTELFGWATPLLSGQRARIGYRALADLDRTELGGDGNGKIDAGDAAFHRLCVWNDRNRNGASDPDEIRSAAEAGLVSLDYAYRTTGQRDVFGNLFRYVSRAEMRTHRGKIRSWLTYDVIFVEGEDE